MSFILIAGFLEVEYGDDDRKDELWDTLRLIPSSDESLLFTDLTDWCCGCFLLFEDGETANVDIAIVGLLFSKLGRKFQDGHALWESEKELFKAK